MKVFSNKTVSVKDVCHGNTAGESKNDLAMEAAGLTTTGIILNHSGQIWLGCAVYLQSHSSQCCKLPEPKGKTDHQSDQKLEEGPKFLKAGDAVLTDRVLGKHPL